MSAIVAAHENGGGHTKVRVVSGSRDTVAPLRVTGLDSLLAVYPALFRRTAGRLTAPDAARLARAT
jgi:hypothetical protein